MSPSANRMACALLSVGGIGYLRAGPATAATIAGAGAALVLAPGRLARLAATGAAAAAGQFLASRVVGPEEPDPQFVVLDELAGVWLTLVAVEPTVSNCATAAVVFRGLDKFKPGPIRSAEMRWGRFSLMGDDLITGMLGGFLLWTFARVRSRGG